MYRTRLVTETFSKQARDPPRQGARKARVFLVHIRAFSVYTDDTRIEHNYNGLKICRPSIMRLYFIFSSDTQLPRQLILVFIQYVFPYNLYMAKVSSLSKLDL